jgi:hypothetical protein
MPHQRLEPNTSRIQSRASPLDQSAQYPSTVSETILTDVCSSDSDEDPYAPKLLRTTDRLLGGFSLTDYRKIKQNIYRIFNGKRVKFRQQLVKLQLLLK